MYFNKKKILLVTVLLMFLLSVVVFGNKSKWHKIGDEIIKIFSNSEDNKTYLISKGNSENTKVNTDDGLIATGSVHEYIISVDDPSKGLGETKKIVLKYEVLDNNKKLLGFLEENTGINYDLNKNRDKLVFDIGFNSIWIVDNDGNYKKVLEINEKDIKNNGYEGEYPVLASNPKFTPDGSKIVYVTNCDEKGLNKLMHLWIVDQNGKNRNILYKGKSNHIDLVGWKDINTAILSEENKILNLDIHSGQTEIVINNARIESISLDNRKLVYVPKINNIIYFDQLTVYNLFTNQATALPKLINGFTYSGFISWAPSSDKFAFLAANAEAEKTALVVMNILNNEQKIFDDYNVLLQINPEDNPIQWLDENQVTVAMHDKNDHSKKQTWIVNINE